MIRAVFHSIGHSSRTSAYVGTCRIDSFYWTGNFPVMTCFVGNVHRSFTTSMDITKLSWHKTKRLSFALYARSKRLPKRARDGSHKMQVWSILFLPTKPNDNDEQEVKRETGDQKAF